MFMTIVFVLLMALLIVAGGGALQLGIFKAQSPETPFYKKVFGGILSYGFSALVWFFMYSHHYLKW